MYYSKEEKEEKIIKLVSTTIGDSDGDILEVSTSSPIGKVLYKKSVGSFCSYEVNGNKFNVVINQKFEKEINNQKILKK